MAATIEWDKIGQLLWAAPLATLAVAITFSVLILGAARAQDAQREGDGGQAARYSIVALLALAAFVVVVVYGIAIIVEK